MIKLGKKKDAAAEAAPAAEGAEGEDAPKKKKLPLLFIIIPAALVVLGGGGAAAFFLLQPKPAPAEAEEGEHGAEKADDGHGDEKKKGGDAKGDGKKKDDGHGGGGDAEGAPDTGVIAEGPDGVVFYSLPAMIVNIQSPDGRPTLLKLKLTLEMSDPEAAYKLQAAFPRLNDMFQGFLRELRPDDLAGSAGTHQLRAEILRRVNLVAAPAKADAVLIEEMLIQ